MLVESVHWRASAVGSGELQSRKQGHTKVNNTMNCRIFLLRLVLLPTVVDTLLLPSQTPYILSYAPFSWICTCFLEAMIFLLMIIQTAPLGTQWRKDADGNWRELFAHPFLLYHLFLLTSAILPEQCFKLCEPPIPENLVLLRSRVISACPIILFISPCTCYSQCGLCSFSPM